MMVIKGVFQVFSSFIPETSAENNINNDMETERSCRDIQEQKVYSHKRKLFIKDM